jgi:hypothetical protein
MALVLVAVFALPAFQGACCAGVEVIASEVESTGDGCCPGESTRAGGEAPDDGESDEAPCSCPFPCSAGCAGYLGRVLAPTNALTLAEPVPALAALVDRELAEPVDPDPRDILHVPIRLAA